MPLNAPGVLAHQGGWDEMILVALPVILFAVLLRIANARADRLATDERQSSSPTDPPPEGTE
ncbi:hypothetical protein KSP35_20095 [Aquihabitans sp. G128]|uniref:hypothetical protein n=1 Tax=Aquihabitans sp. G128 TaxID=2849779 RepID=UPI001C21C3E6|nr:hypothetical protein [Aquihabitans sp. G128]QXC60597.1 hypothetical protein KSP35_20095 [Aquihabitans sp. G128]